jgi:hypothetical protein
LALERQLQEMQDRTRDKELKMEKKNSSSKEVMLIKRDSEMNRIEKASDKLRRSQRQ